MVETQLAPEALDAAMRQTTGAVRGDVREVMSAGRYYVTPEICRELKHIKTGADHIRLDHDFTNSSREFHAKFDPQRLAMDSQGAAVALSRSHGTMGDVKSRLNAASYPTKMDNVVREDHHWAVQTLRGIERDIGPYAHQSIDRVKQFCDHMGVTDRYTGYRHNLNRGRRDPVRLGYSWLDTQKNEYNNTLHTGWRQGSAPISRPRDSPLTSQSMKNVRFEPPRSAPLNSSRVQQLRDTGAPGRSVTFGSTKSIQEQCGINTTFPGISEYTTRYTGQQRDGPLTGFTINPRVDFEASTGRPLMTLVAPDKGGTEYQNRYEWPDGNKIERLPWLRK